MSSVASPKDGSEGIFHKIWGQLEKSSSSSYDGEAPQTGIMEHMSIEFANSSSSLDSKGSRHTPEHNTEAMPAANNGSEAVADLETIGSELHSVGQCRPCDFFKGGLLCRHGRECKFCHFHRDERRVRLSKSKRMKLARQRLATLGLSTGEEMLADSGGAQASNPSIISL